MYTLSDLQTGTYILWQNEPAQIIWREHTKLGRGGAILRTKIRGLVSGAIYDHTFKGSDAVEAAEVSRRRAQFLYGEGDKLNFMLQDDFDQFSLNKKIVGAPVKFLQDGMEVEVLLYGDKPINIQLPVKVELKVTYAEPAVRGNTAQGNVTKIIELEGGARINAPLFVKSGDVVRVNTQTGAYVERA
ncbi:MAG TPA: elongation factor P [Patescibacteria group bacterium]|nr:elongation factor P [Patescibacteria group bacterium]